MAFPASVERIDLAPLASAGGTLPLSNNATFGTLTNYNLYVLQNAITLTGTINIQPETTASSDSIFLVVLQNTITVSSGGVTFFGASVDNALLKAGTTMLAYYNGSAYVTTIFPDFKSAQFIVNSMIKDRTLAVSKIANSTAANVLMWDASGLAVAQPIHGDIVVDDNGNALIQANAVDTNKILNQAVDGATKILDASIPVEKLTPALQTYFAQPTLLYYIRVEVASADILTLGSTRITFVTGEIGVDLQIQKVTGGIGGLSAPYTTHTALHIGNETATIGQVASIANGLLLSSADRNGIVIPAYPPNSVSVNQIVTGDGLAVWVDGGDPAAGDGNIVLDVWYSKVSR